MLKLHEKESKLFFFLVFLVLTAFGFQEMDNRISHVKIGLTSSNAQMTDQYQGEVNAGSNPQPSTLVDDSSSQLEREPIKTNNVPETTLSPRTLDASDRNVAAIFTFGSAAIALGFLLSLLKSVSYRAMAHPRHVAKTMALAHIAKIDPNTPRELTLKRCPSCGREDVPYTALNCPFCTSAFN